MAVNAGLRNGTFYVECVSMIRRVNTPTTVASVQVSRLFSGGLSVKARVSKPASSATWQRATPLQMSYHPLNPNRSELLVRVISTPWYLLQNKLLVAAFRRPFYRRHERGTGSLGEPSVDNL